MNKVQFEPRILYFHFRLMLSNCQRVAIRFKYFKVWLVFCVARILRFDASVFLCLPLSSSVFLCLHLLVQGSRVQVLPSALWDHAVRPDPRAAHGSEKVLLADRPRVQHRTAARARTGASAVACWAGSGPGGGRGGRGGGPVTPHHKQPGRRSCTGASASRGRPVALSPQRPPQGSCRTLGLSSPIISRLSATTHPHP